MINVPQAEKYYSEIAIHLRERYRDQLDDPLRSEYMAASCNGERDIWFPSGPNMDLFLRFVISL
jgi:hypothetical protein